MGEGVTALVPFRIDPRTLDQLFDGWDSWQDLVEFLIPFSPDIQVTATSTHTTRYTARGPPQGSVAPEVAVSTSSESVSSRMFVVEWLL